jgi:hypothetical protein
MKIDADAFAYSMRLFVRLRFDDGLKSKGRKPRYVIPVRFKYDAKQWVKEIEEC